MFMDGDVGNPTKAQSTGFLTGWGISLILAPQGQAGFAIMVFCLTPLLAILFEDIKKAIQ